LRPRLVRRLGSVFMRLLVARCRVVYSGRLSAVLPEATRLIMLKGDGSVLVHADCGGYKPLKCDLTKRSNHNECGSLLKQTRQQPSARNASWISCRRS
jgi:RecB family endonuclease NucS